MNPGEVLDGRYEIVARLGAGGMGEVYKATHTFLGSSRVIKVVHPQIATNADARDRFLREAKIATKVQHPNVATLHDFASLPDGSHYMVWEFIEGENLAQKLRTAGTLPPRQAVRIAVQALHGLEAIHKAGIVHRDISPENLMITPDGTVKIIDLGVAKIDDPDAVSQTRTGIFVGKLRYAAPEQLGFLPDGEKIDGRADLYALAMVVVELLTGRPPYEAKSPHEYFLHHAKEIPVTTIELPASLPGSYALQEVLQKALRRNRDERWANAAEFAGALEEIERTLPDAATTATVALDTDATWRPGSGVAETVRTPSPAPPVATTPPVATQPDLQPTVRTPMPAPPPPAAQQKSSSGALVAVLVVVFLLLAGGVSVGAYLFWPKITSVISSVMPTKKPQVAPIKTVPTPAPTTPQRVSESAISVSPANTSSTAAAPKTEPPIKVVEQKKPVKTAQLDNPPMQQQQIAPPAEEHPGRAPNYIDGGRRGRNDRALDRLHEELRGVTKVSLLAGSEQTMVYRAIHRYLPDLEFDADSPVVITFGSTAQRLGYDSQGLGSSATITKNGRVIFRYNFPYSGDHAAAAESFAQTLAEAIGE